jgi:phosphatidylglycerol:prolipoprotein diacylglycerol transferase
MTIYPLVLRLGGFEITGFGLMMMVAFLAGGWIVGLELRRRRLREEYATDMVAAAVIGGVVGAKLWYVALTQDLGSLLSRGGLVWYGGFIGGAAAVLINGWRLKVPVRWTMQLGAPALAAAYALGRVGCFLVGDDYGRPTDLPWGVRFPQGIPPSSAGFLQSHFGVAVPAGVDPGAILPVHPTQLYETAIMLGVFAALWKLRTRPAATGWLFGAYLVFAGAERFLVEILRAKDDRFLGPFTLAQLTSVGLMLLGGVLMARWKGGAELPTGDYLSGTPKGSLTRPSSAPPPAARRR